MFQATIIRLIFSKHGIALNRESGQTNENDKLYFVYIFRLCLGIRKKDSVAQMLLHQNVMWLRKVTNLWCDSEMKFPSNDYTNPNTNPKALTTLTLTLTDPHGAFESFCVPVFCDFIWNYFLGTFGLLDTSYFYTFF